MLKEVAAFAEGAKFDALFCVAGGWAGGESLSFFIGSQKESFMTTFARKWFVWGASCLLVLC